MDYFLARMSNAFELTASIGVGQLYRSIIEEQQKNKAAAEESAQDDTGTALINCNNFDNQARRHSIAIITIDYSNISPNTSDSKLQEKSVITNV